MLLAADGPKVIDFGISRPSDSEMRTETGKLIERHRHGPRAVPAAARGGACGRCLRAGFGAGARGNRNGPFDSESPYIVAYQVVHDEADLTAVPQELAPLIESCLAKHPEDPPTRTR